MEGRIAGQFYSVDKCLETLADPRNFWDKQSFKNLDAMFIGILPRDLVRDFRVEFESSRHSAIFEISWRYREPP